MADGANNEYEMFLPTVDVNDGLKRVMGKKKLYVSLLGRFNPRKMVDDLLAVIDSSEYQKIVEAAHAVKGASGNLGFVGLKNVMADVEARAKAETQSADLVDQINDVLTETESIIAQIIAMPVE